MKNKRLIYSAFLSGILIAAIGCSENEQSVPLDENELIELQVSPKVTLTRSAINGGEQTGNGANVMQNIAVYAQSTTTNTDAKKNNYAIYTLGSGTWSNSGTDKIYLSSEDATVYAYYPAYAPGSNGEYATSTALKISGDASATSTIPLTVYEGGTGTDANYTIAHVAMRIKFGMPLPVVGQTILVPIKNSLPPHRAKWTICGLLPVPLKWTMAEVPIRKVQAQRSP